MVWKFPNDKLAVLFSSSIEPLGYVTRWKNKTKEQRILGTESKSKHFVSELFGMIWEILPKSTF